MPPQSRTRLVGFGLLVATFIVGALTGAAVDRVVSADERPSRSDSREDGDRNRGRYVIDRVDMATDQRAAIDAILERRADRMRAVWRQVEPHLDAVTDSARAEIMQVLTPEQRAEYERMLRERRMRRQDREDDDEGERADSVKDGR